MKSMHFLSQIIGSDLLDQHLIGPLIELTNDKNWRVKMALIEFVPAMIKFVDKEVFKNRMESVVLGWLSDNVY